MKPKFSDLIGKTLSSVEKVGEDLLIFQVDKGENYRLFHNQDCCETVRIEDICGDLNDLVGSPIVQAEENSNKESHPEGYKPESPPDDSFTWTFYRIATAKGQCVIRWLGESNGYYSEEVDFDLSPR